MDAEDISAKSVANRGASRSSTWLDEDRPRSVPAPSTNQSFQFNEPTGRGTAVRLIAALGVPVAVFLGYALLGNGGKGGAGITWAVWFVCGVAFYFLPCIEANLRQQPNIVSIALVNVFLGWTLVGWVVAMSWACTARSAPDPRPIPSTAPPVPSAQRPTQETRRDLPSTQVSVADELRKLADLKDRGLLSEAEFAAQKAKLLS